MPTIDVFYSIRPKRGKYIADGKYGFGIVDGAPAMRCRWVGRFSRIDQIFHFQTQTEKFAFLDTKSMITHARWGRQTSPYVGMLGLLPSLAVTGAVTAWQAATTKMEGAQAFAVSYQNPQGDFGVFVALAPAEFVDQIAACLPPDKINDERKKAEEL